MKSKKFKVAIFLIMFTLLFGMFPNFSFMTSRAAIVEDSFTDSALVGALKDYYKEVIGEELVTITDKSFNRAEFSHINLNREGRANKISDLTGLEKLDFNYTISLDLAGNSVKEFTKDVLSGFNEDALSSIDLSNNNISVFDIVSDTDKCTKDFRSIKFLDVSGNKIQKIDLIEMINGGDIETPAIVDASNNKINSAEDITISKSSNLNLSLNLVGNNIYNSDLIVKNGLKLVLGNQGWKDNKKLTTTTKFNYTKLNMENVYLTFYDKLNEKALPELTINESLLESNFNEFQLGIGKYIVSYIYDENGDGIQDETLPEDLSVFEKNILSISQEFTINPSKPTYVFIIDGKEKESVKHISGFADIKVETIDNATIMYKYSYESEWHEGNVVKLSRGGNYGVNLKVVSGEFESETVYIDIYSSTNPKVPDFLLIIIIAGVFLILMFIVLPLLGKYFVKR